MTSSSREPVAAQPIGRGDDRPAGRVLVLAPFGRDAEEICRTLGEAGIEAVAYASGAELCGAIDQHAGMALITEEGLTREVRAHLGAVLAAQPDWSDFPILVLASAFRPPDRLWSMLRRIGGASSLVLLERPLHTGSLVSAVSAALASRRRQLQVRDELNARLRAERQLRESDHRYRTLFDGNIIGVIVADMDRILEANAAFLEMIGATREDLEQGRIDWRAMTPAEYRPLDERALRELETRGACHPFQKEYIRTDGSRVPIMIGASVLTRDPLTWMCFVLDTTDLQRASQKLRRLNESLERQVAERTAVAERRADDLRRLAAELSHAEQRERKRLARLLHSDLQQLLLAARLRLPTLMQGGPEQLEQNRATLDGLLGQCIEQARSLAHEMSPSVLQVGTLADVIEWIADWFGRMHDLTVATTVPEGLPSGTEDLRVFVFQAVRELLTNAAKHSGSTDVRITAANHADGIAVDVEDGGTGFHASAIRARLETPGSFGLFSISERAEATGGRLEVHATARGGARMRLVLPVTQDTEPPTPPEPAAVATPRPRAPRVGSGVSNLLIVDDHEVVRAGLTGLLGRQSGLAVVGEAANGLEALRRTRSLRPDAVIMDIDMPGMDGIEATRKIREQYPDITVIGLSVHDEEATGRAMIAAGATAYVRKDAPLGELVAAIRDALDLAGES